MLRNTDKKKKSDIENSNYYLTYRMLQIIQNILKGRKYPNGMLTQSQFKYHVYNIVDFVTRPFVLDFLLNFDSDAFFQSVVGLFSGKPWHYINVDETNYEFEFTK